MKPDFRLKPGESAPQAITRLYRHLRTLSPAHKPDSHYAARIKSRAAERRAQLHLVK
ncbi:MAG: hypothetical protein AB7U30_00035 [Sulfuricellaceae bacterium]|jgi:hypothetical protein